MGGASNVRACPTLTSLERTFIHPASISTPETTAMKVRSSLKSLKTRHRACRIVRRKGRIYVINKVDPRYKAKQG